MGRQKKNPTSLINGLQKREHFVNLHRFVFVSEFLCCDIVTLARKNKLCSAALRSLFFVWRAMRTL